MPGAAACSRIPAGRPQGDGGKGISMFQRTVARTVAVVAAAAFLVSGAFAFEYTRWTGPLTLAHKARVKKGAKTNVRETLPDADLQTEDGAFTLSNLGPDIVLPVMMEGRNERNYRHSTAEGESLGTFKEWLRQRILADTGQDVDLVACSLKGKSVLNGDFDQVKVGDKIKYVGTVVGGPDDGKPVKGSIKLKAVLDRVLDT